MTESPLTIVATVRNECLTIDGFIQSLLKQTHRPAEIIVVDGASIDGTLEILEKFAARGEIKLISQDCNIAQGRNLGIASVNTRYVAVTDAGCNVDKNWLLEIASCITKNPEADVIAANYSFETQSRFEAAVIHATFSARRDSTEVSPFHPSSRSVAFSKEAWTRAGGYPEWLYAAEDTLFNIKLRRQGCHFVFCPNAIVEWRPRENWKSLAKQRINFSRGNSRIGFGTAAYINNLRVHAIATLFIMLGIWQPLAFLVTITLLARHVSQNLWPQARRKVPSNDVAMRIRVLAVMEFIRLVQIYGYLLGQWDRFIDPSFKRNQIDYIGVASLSPSSGAHIPESRSQENRRNTIYLSILIAIAAIGSICSISNGVKYMLDDILVLASISLTVTLFSGIKSLTEFTHTGPRLRDEIVRHYKRYTILSFLRLLGFVFVVACLLTLPGIASYSALSRLTASHYQFYLSVTFGSLSIILLTALQFSRHLLWLPANITASYSYRISRLYPYWRRLSPSKLRIATILLLGIPAAIIAYTAISLFTINLPASATAYSSILFFYIALGLWLRTSEPPPTNSNWRKGQYPNIIMIGSDTLRSDRIDGSYARNVAPFISGMIKQGILFSQCHVPCARTAPSLLSLLSGMWPHRFGVRDNFVPDEAKHISLDTLPHILKKYGYYTAALSDWCGADMAKFDLGFDHKDVPEDQWNIKLFIRQGPKDLRLFLSLFARNRAGKMFLPEIHYLGGVPQTYELGLEARHLISQMASENQPFFLNVFFSTTHGPFGSEFPYYTRYADSNYNGESKFVMSRVTDPWEIIRRQAEPREEFDLDQIINLYDGCVARFDEEVRRIMDQLSKSGLSDNTIVAIYSDHGMEFFEHQTWGQGNSVISDFSNKIPLLILAPEINHARVIEQPIRSIDLAPTLLDIAGIPVPSGIDGTSLKPFIKNPDLEPKLEIYGETGIWLTELPGSPAGHLRYPNLLDLLTVRNIMTGTISIKPEYEELIIRAKDRFFRYDRWKLVYQPLQEGYLLKLFDVMADPDCKHDVSSSNQNIVRDMWNNLQGWMLSDPAVARIVNIPSEQQTPGIVG